MYLLNVKIVYLNYTNIIYFFDNWINSLAIWPVICFSERSHQSTLPLKTISFLIHLHLSAAFYFWSSPSCPGSVGASIHCQTEQHPVCFALHITLRTTCTHTLHNPSGRVNLAHVNSYCLWNTSITNQACLWNSNTAFWWSVTVI